MTLELKETDRIYKIIEAEIGNDLHKKFVSKIDKDGNVTVYTYIFDVDDIKEDGTIENKRMGMIAGPFPDIEFYDFIDYNYDIYPIFNIVTELDYSSMTLEEAIEKMKKDNKFVVSE